MANPGAHTAIDVQRHAGGLPYGSFSGPYNTVGGDVGAYNTVCVMVAAEYRFVQGMVPGTVVLTCELCLAFLRTFSGSYRTGRPRSDGPQSENSDEQGFL